MGLIREFLSLYGLAKPRKDDERVASPAVSDEAPATGIGTSQGDSLSLAGRDDFVSRYLNSELWDDLLVNDEDGMPPFRLVSDGASEWLAENKTGGFVNVGNKHLRWLGIWSVKVRGTSHYAAAAQIGPCDLVREPDNQYDKNAIAIYCGGKKIGYWNKGMAVGLSRAIDGGEALVARIISTSPTKVIACSPEAMKHLLR